MSKPTDLVQGTLDLLILEVIALEPMHGWAIAQRIRQMSNDVLQVGPGLALSGAAQARAAGLDRGRVGREREQPPRQVLHAHARRAPRPEAGGGAVGTAVGRHLRDRPSRLIGSTTMRMLRTIRLRLRSLLPGPPRRAGSRRRAARSPGAAKSNVIARRTVAGRRSRRRARGVRQRRADPGAVPRHAPRQSRRRCAPRSALRAALDAAGRPATPPSPPCRSRWRSAPTPRSSASCNVLILRDLPCREPARAGGAQSRSARAALGQTPATSRIRSTSASATERRLQRRARDVGDEHDRPAARRRGAPADRTLCLRKLLRDAWRLAGGRTAALAGRRPARRAGRGDRRRHRLRPVAARVRRRSSRRSARR